MPTEISDDCRVEPPVREHLRMTIPVREALARAGNQITPSPPVGPDDDPYHAYRVVLCGDMPDGIVECIIECGRYPATSQHRGLRMSDEPEYPGEMRGAVSWWERGEWVPCPRQGCSRPLVWYEAGYVPGYRVCTRGHHAQLSGDGRSAKVM